MGLCSCVFCSASLFSRQSTLLLAFFSLQQSVLYCVCISSCFRTSELMASFMFFQSSWGTVMWSELRGSVSGVVSSSPHISLSVSWSSPCPCSLRASSSLHPGYSCASSMSGIDWPDICIPHSLHFHARFASPAHPFFIMLPTALHTTHFWSFLW